MFLDKIRKIKEKELISAKKPKKDVFSLFRANRINIIAEIKKASPSKGDIAPCIDIIKTAKDYINANARALSVLSEKEYFKGDIEYIEKIRAEFKDAIILRKDFIIDDYQLYETKLKGADMVLLILGLTKNKTKSLIKKAKSLGLEVLLEVHSESEMKQALKLDINFIGINNRNLKTLQVDLETSRKLAKYITEDKIFVCESGLETAKQIKEMAQLGYRAFLIGTSFMSAKDPGNKLKTLLNEAEV